MKSRKKRITIAVGTRPELIKLAPVIDALKARPNVQLDVIFTGQHVELLRDLAAFFGISPSHTVRFERRGSSLNALTGELLAGISQCLRKTFPEIVICQGDTTSALTAAMAARNMGVSVAHVEAGLRSGNLSSPFPEEGNRRMISAIAAHHFAPTEHARENLLREGVDPESILVTGNTVIDALLKTATRKDLRLPAELERHEDVVLITLHRRENLRRFQDILAGIGAAAARHPDTMFAWPVHPNPLVQSGAEALLTSAPNIMLLPPLSYGAFIASMKHARLILTDSGGIQEEAPYLGTPVLVLREETERTEGLAHGVATLVGTRSRDILEATTLALASSPDLHAPAANLYGDGRAAERIAEALAPMPHPTTRSDEGEKQSNLTDP